MRGVEGTQAAGDAPLSPREEQIVRLAVEGRTNEDIGAVLGLSHSTVNSYWMRIRMKLHGKSRTAVVGRLVRETAEATQRGANLLADQMAEMHTTLVDLRTVLSLFHLALEQIGSAVWSTDADLRLRVIACGETQDCFKDMAWSVGNTVFEVFNTTSNDHPAVAAPFSALGGTPSETRLALSDTQLMLFVQPLKVDDGTITGCVGVLARMRSDV